MMKRVHILGFACATVCWAGTALALPTAQQNCDYARVTAWTKYLVCVNAVVAKDAKGVVFDELAAFAKCRHTYFKTWTGFQPKASLSGSTCIGNRFTDNGTTVTDKLTGLVWEKKTNLDGSSNFSDPHDADNRYNLCPGFPPGSDHAKYSTALDNRLK
jgi:hypothetical protein